MKDTTKTNLNEPGGHETNGLATTDPNGGRTVSGSQKFTNPDTGTPVGETLALEVRGLWTGYNGHPALEDINI